MLIMLAVLIRIDRPLDMYSSTMVLLAGVASYNKDQLALLVNLSMYLFIPLVRNQGGFLNYLVRFSLICARM